MFNITALPYAPYWMTNQEGNSIRYSGTDFNQITTTAQALNFTLNVLPSENWDEVDSLYPINVKIYVGLYKEVSCMISFEAEALYAPRWEALALTLSAWPIPQGAPYTPNLDRCIMAHTEAGLYEQWRKEILLDIKRQNRIKKREELKHQQHTNDLISESADGSIEALSTVHLQGPFLLLLLGLASSVVLFVAEKLIIFVTKTRI
ncbi:uncharacterized protein [Cherax quadricarinatus]|uniref:uncharacterized protein n=1 Tax=Cherax quadricarinatus TaxID=27406 RepID=UPI00387EBA09